MTADCNEFYVGASEDLYAGHAEVDFVVESYEAVARPAEDYTVRKPGFDCEVRRSSEAHELIKSYEDRTLLRFGGDNVIVRGC